MPDSHSGRGVLAIKPIIDFVFKKILGSPEYSQALVGLVNAILDRTPPTDTIEILNPFNCQEFADGKQVVLDVCCRDRNGTWLNVEMQVMAYPALMERLMYDASSMYVGQMKIGQHYAQAKAAISICLVCHSHFRQSHQPHHQFRMLDTSSGNHLAQAIETHTVELTKYPLNVASIGSQPPLYQWAFLLLHGQDYNSGTLRQLLPGPEFQTAISALEIISAKSEDKRMYDQREKARRDYEWAMSGARAEGLERGWKRDGSRGSLPAESRCCSSYLVNASPGTPNSCAKAVNNLICYSTHCSSDSSNHDMSP